MSAHRAFERPAVKLAAFACTAAVALGGGALIGSAVGPEPSESPAHGHDAPGSGAGSAVPDSGSNQGAAVPAGVAVSRDGFTLALAETTFTSGEPIELAFRILGPDGHPVTEFEVAHDKELHLIVVSRDLVDFLHVHPERSADGTWTIALPPRRAGSYRVFADFAPSGAAPLTLGADLAVAGDFVPADLPEPANAVEVDGYRVTLDGVLKTGSASKVTLTVSGDDGPVADLDPYLGALGHLVAVRDGDLAYLHVHPAAEVTEPGGPLIEFEVEVPTPGRYRLFLDFSHRGEVHTAAFTVDAERGDGTAGGDESPTASTTGHAHGDD